MCIFPERLQWYARNIRAWQCFEGEPGDVATSCHQTKRYEPLNTLKGSRLNFVCIVDPSIILASFFSHVCSRFFSRLALVSSRHERNQRREPEFIENVVASRQG